VDRDVAQPKVESAVQVDEQRRDALRRIGKFAAYTAPTLIAMLASEKALAVTGGGCT
jgi:hypothetical protein